MSECCAGIAHQLRPQVGHGNLIFRLDSETGCGKTIQDMPVIDRAHWSKRVGPEAMKVPDAVLEILRSFNPGMDFNFTEVYIGIGLGERPHTNVVSLKWLEGDGTWVLRLNALGADAEVKTLLEKTKLRWEFNKPRNRYQVAVPGVGSITDLQAVLDRVGRCSQTTNKSKTELTPEQQQSLDKIRDKVHSNFIERAKTDFGVMLKLLGLEIDYVNIELDVDGGGTVQGMNGDSTTAKNQSGQTKSLDWAEIIEATTDPTVVTDTALRDAIVKTGLPWRVRDKGTGIEMVLIPPGEFVMGKSPGDEEAESYELPAHEVRLTNAFYLGRYTVTQQQYAKVMGKDPSKFSAKGESFFFTVIKPGLTSKEAFRAVKEQAVRGLELPVETVSWNDCDAFCKKTNLRLPTEAEWEYACRARHRTARYGVLDEIAWHDGNSDQTTHAIGTKKANGFGLYDMLGNVFEWVNDYYGAYSDDEQTNPQGPSWGSYRVVRGGSWYHVTHCVRSSFRAYGTPHLSNDYLGFRVSRTP